MHVYDDNNIVKYVFGKRTTKTRRFFNPNKKCIRNQSHISLLLNLLARTVCTERFTYHRCAQAAADEAHFVIR